MPGMCYYTLHKKTQQDFDRCIIYFFNHVFILSHVRYHWKARSHAFLLMPYWCYDCLMLWLFDATGACLGGINWGQCSKWKVRKFDQIVRRCHVLCPIRHAYSCLYRNSQKQNIVQNFKYWCNFATFNFWHCPQFCRWYFGIRKQCIYPSLLCSMTWWVHIHLSECW